MGGKIKFNLESMKNLLDSSDSENIILVADAGIYFMNNANDQSDTNDRIILYPNGMTAETDPEILDEQKRRVFGGDDEFQTFTKSALEKAVNLGIADGATDLEVNVTKRGITLETAIPQKPATEKKNVTTNKGKASKGKGASKAKAAPKKKAAKATAPKTKAPVAAVAVAAKTTPVSTPTPEVTPVADPETTPTAVHQEAKDTRESTPVPEAQTQETTAAPETSTESVQETPKVDENFGKRTAECRYNKDLGKWEISVLPDGKELFGGESRGVGSSNIELPWVKRTFRDACKGAGTEKPKKYAKLGISKMTVFDGNQTYEYDSANPPKATPGRKKSAPKETVAAGQSATRVDPETCPELDVIGLGTNAGAKMKGRDISQPGSGVQTLSFVTPKEGNTFEMDFVNGRNGMSDQSGKPFQGWEIVSFDQPTEDTTPEEATTGTDAAKSA